MGRVCRVRKRSDAVGGSARPAFVQKHQASGCCWQWCRQTFPFLQRNDTKAVFFNSASTEDMTRLQQQQQQQQPLLHNNQQSTSGSSATPAAAPLTTESSETQNMDTPKYLTPASSMDDDTTFLQQQQQQYFHKRKQPSRYRGYTKQSSLISYHARKGENAYALKSIHLDRCSSDTFVQELKNEVEILKGLDHPCIVRAMETFDFRNRLYIVLELCEGGDLYTREPYTEQQAQKITKDLFSAVAYLHSRDIIHRDLKFENVMFVKKNPNDFSLKLIDFGLSQKFADNEHLHDQVGTVYTMSPELLAGDYTSQADVWSLGVICFMLLSSSMPFYGKTRVQVIKRILRAKYRFSARRWATITPAAMNFCAACLTMDPDERPSALEAQHLPWLRVDFAKTSPTPRIAVTSSENTDPSTDVSEHNKHSSRSIGENGAAIVTDLPPAMAEELDQMDRIQSSIFAFSEYGRLKKLALLVVAYKSTTEEIGFLREMFERFDVEKDGEISQDEFQRVLSTHYDYSSEELQVMFQGIDVDGTGSVHYSEFLAATLEAHGMLDEERLAEAFDRLDADDSGYITVADLSDFLGADVPEKYLHAVIEEADIEGDQRISYKEFMALWSYEDDDRMSEVRSEVASRHLTPASSFISSISGSYHGSTEDDDSYHHKKKEMEAELHKLEERLPFEGEVSPPNDLPSHWTKPGASSSTTTKPPAIPTKAALHALQPPPAVNRNGPVRSLSSSAPTKGTAPIYQQQQMPNSEAPSQQPPLIDPSMKDAVDSTVCFRKLQALSVRPMGPG